MWLTFFKKCKPAQNLLFTLFAAFFVRSGNISLDYGSLKTAGFNAQDWSNSCQVYIMPNGGTAFLLTINNYKTLPSHGPHQRYFGFPVRCLV